MTPRYQSRQLMRPEIIDALAPPVRTMAASWLSSCRFCSQRRSAGFRKRAFPGVGARKIWPRAQGMPVSVTPRLHVRAGNAISLFLLTIQSALKRANLWSSAPLREARCGRIKK